jgi:hypothetical protein
MLVNPTSDEKSISKLYKELILIARKQMNRVLESAKELIRHFSKDIQMFKWHMRNAQYFSTRGKYKFKAKSIIPYTCQYRHY